MITVKKVEGCLKTIKITDYAAKQTLWSLGQIKFQNIIKRSYINVQEGVINIYNWWLILQKSAV